MGNKNGVMLKVSECKESKTNPRGPVGDVSDLSASIKEHGVLQPIIVRTAANGGYEVIAGNRRLAAAKLAGLEEIPARIMELADPEALEVQIIENLQRADVHPIEEGEAYRRLTEDAAMSVPDIAVRVGKGEKYVRQRLFLTNLSANGTKQYRNGKISDSAAAVLARLPHKEQDVALRDASEWRFASGKELAEYIAEKFGTFLSFQPWASNSEIAAVVGPCTKCPANRETLFGKVADGTCVSVECWKVKMAKYLAWRKKENPALLLISTEYGDAPSGAVSRRDYATLSTKVKEHCGSATKAIVVQGEKIGNEQWVCADPKCKSHAGSHSDYTRTPAEKERKKKEREQEKRRAAATEKRLKESLARVVWPLKEKHLDALLTVAMSNTSANVWRMVAKRHEITVQKTKDSWGGSRYDYDAAVKKWAAGLGKTEQARLAFELLIDNGYGGLHEGVGKL